MLSQKYPSYVKEAIKCHLLKGYTLPLTSLMMISLIAPFDTSSNSIPPFAYLYKDYKDRKKGNGLPFWTNSFNLNSCHPIISNVSRYTICNMLDITNKVKAFINPNIKNPPYHHPIEWHERSTLISLIKQKNLMLVI